jgi:uncharacterized protein
MFDVGKILRRRSALWLVFPPALLLVTLFISRSANSRVSLVLSPSKYTHAHKHSDAETNLLPDPTADMDHDGLPDILELRSFNDRDNFRNWFTSIAEMQFYKMSNEWNPEQRDCAGLVRFAWREALRSHDREWYQRIGEGYKTVAPDVSVKLGSEPLGEKLFRTAPGNYRPADVAAGKFSEFADAQTLKLFNATFISRDRDQAKPGDLLFFYQPFVQKFPYHVMIFLGDARVANEGQHDWVVYHTGAAPENGGAVKKVRLAVLDGHPNKRWRPIETNPNFLGFYRLKLLDQQASLEE